jgi:hypothetical protein
MSGKLDILQINLLAEGGRGQDTIPKDAIEALSEELSGTAKGALAFIYTDVGKWRFYKWFPALKKEWKRVQYLDVTRHTYQHTIMLHNRTALVIDKRYDDVRTPAAGILTFTQPITYEPLVGYTAPVGYGSIVCATQLTDGRILCFIGFIYDSHRVAFLDLHTKKWTITQISREYVLYDFSCILMQDGNVMIAGGVDSDNDAIDDCYTYNPIDNSIKKLASMNHPRSRPGLCILPTGNIFACGGNRGKMEEYDPAKNEWTVLNDIISETINSKCIVVGREVLMAGENWDNEYWTEIHTYGLDTKGTIEREWPMDEGAADLALIPLY